jgi:hypothetical protein
MGDEIMIRIGGGARKMMDGWLMRVIVATKKLPM